MCECFARCEADCVCDHDWTPPELTAARERIAVLEAERDQLRAALANLKALLRSICEEWNEGCDPACDSFGHTDTCKGTNIAQAKRAMRDEIERLRAVVGSIERVAACGTAEAFLGISDDGKRLHFAMSVRDAGRLKKAQEEIERLRAELEESRAKHLDDRLVLEATAKAERLLRGENEVLKDLIAGAADELGDFPPSKRWADQFVKRTESALAAKGDE